MKKLFGITLALALVISTILGATALAASTGNAAAEAALLSYVDTTVTQSADLAAANLDDIITTITFSQYLSFDEFEAYVTAYNIDVAQLQLRGLMEDGTRVSIFSKTNKGFEETEQLLNQQATDEGFTIVGISGVNALVDSEMLSAVQSDSKTYLADTSADNFSTQNSNPNSATRNATEQQDRGGMFPQSLSWKLEDLGLLG